MNKRFLIRPRQHSVLGQDFRSSLIARELSLTHIDPDPGREYEDPELLVCFDPEDADILKCVKRFKATPVVAHFQLPWSYQLPDEQDRARETLGLVDAVIVPTDELKHELEKEIPGSQVYRACNGASREVFSPASRKERYAYRAAHRIPANVKLLGYVGRLQNSKGLQVLEELLLRLPKLCNLLIYCPESNEALARNRFNGKERARVVCDDRDPLRGKHPTKYLDVLVATSLREAFSMVVLEALQSGVSVVAANSSPFVAEMDSLEAMKLVALPPKLENMNRCELSLERKEVNQIVGEFVRIIEDTTPLDDSERRELAMSVLSLGYTTEAMISRCREVYDEIVRVSTNQGV
ncbi:MAG: glycosyltransferase family 4 protein [bacterium]|nr:glycosyltransferase family 4 protein [bacterium]